MNKDSSFSADSCPPNLSPPKNIYRGRFAPSPSGPLHFGSLVSALASYFDAKTNQGVWLVRMEDIDPPREMPGAADTILHQLEQHGLHWDETVLYQSQRSNAYLAVLKDLKHANLTYPCQCSRQQLKERQGIHNYHCELLDPSAPSALRLSTQESCQITFNDIFQGNQQQNIMSEVGDMVLYRKDNLFAYQLAVVIDDAFQQITHVIRGCDLLSSTPRQIYLQQQLKLAAPQYGHIPMAVNQDGHKLSKQNYAKAIDNNTAMDNLAIAMRWLGLPLPTNQPYTNCDELLTWGISHWNHSVVPKMYEKKV